MSNVVQKSANMNRTTGNGLIVFPSCYGVTTTSKIAGTVTHGLILVVSLVGNALIVVIVY